MLLLVTLTYLYCTTGTGSYYQFGNGLKSARKGTQREHVLWIYQSAQDNMPIDMIFQQMNIS
ncbi:hypothetical protein EQM05_10965 [Clostridium sp. JN-9]|nr:hypothetical protein EQM05_10965 [Clostridium sp. JN-9]